MTASSSRWRVAMWLVGLVLVACQPAPASTPTPNPTVAEQQKPVFGCSDQDEMGFRLSKVTRVVDGDTIEVQHCGRTRPRGDVIDIRLIGVDTPEVYGGVECYGHEASAFTKQHLEDRYVRLEYDVDRIDPYGRTLAYVHTEGGRLFNEVLVRRGFATVATYEPNVKYVNRFEVAESRARDARRGLWGSC